MTTIINDVFYDEKKQLATDIYLPEKTNAETKILLFWHGGGWFRGDKSNLRDYCTQITEQNFIVFAPNYSLAPKYIFPAAHNDSVTFVNWLLNSSYGENRTNAITQLGASSGGVMALFLAGKYGFPTVTWSAPVSFSSWMKNHQDVRPSQQANFEFGITDLKQINDAFYKYFTLTYTGTDKQETLKKLDAQSYDYDNLGRLLMLNSTNELSPTDYLLDFISQLAKANHSVDLKLIAGKRHAMSYASDYLAESISYLAKKPVK